MLLSVGLCSFTCMQPVFIRLSATDNLQQDCLRLFLFFFFFFHSFILGDLGVRFPPPFSHFLLQSEEIARAIK